MLAETSPCGRMCVLQDAESETTKSFPLQEQSVYTVELQVGIKLVLFLVNY